MGQPLSRVRGVTLFVALVALLTMTLAGIALVRSTDTANLIAGNYAFKEAALSASDAGVEAAYAALPGIIQTSLEANIPNQYFATLQPVDSAGVPTTVTWASVPSIQVAGNGVQYVIDRMCQGPTPVTDIQTNCLSDPSPAGGSKKSGAPVFSSGASVYFRVTVKVTGPRGTVSFVQAVLAI